MKKMLSHIVIVALLVIAPVSFSTSKIPNFDIPATRISHIQVSRKANVPIIQRAKQTPPLVFAVCLQQKFFALSLISDCFNNLEISNGRAPPLAVLSV